MLTKTTIQTIRALVELAKLSDGKYEGAASIARKIKAPINYLGKSLQALSSHGLVISQKGFRGGFRLGKDPQGIALYDVAESLENMERFSQCAFGFGECCDISPCPIHQRWKNIRDIHLHFLKETTIKDLVGDEKGKTLDERGK